MANSVQDRSELVILSNRLPVRRRREGDTSRWELSPGGLVSALAAVLAGRRCVWMGWAGVADRQIDPFQTGDILNVPIALMRDELQGYYEGFSTRTIWPLYHDAIQKPEYHREWWRTYCSVNQRFADAAAERVAPDGVVWVHDYHHQLVPAMLRSRRRDVRIGFFLHIPFPPIELFSQIPWRNQILEGILGADLVGFQTPASAENFLAACGHYLPVIRHGNSVALQGRTSRVEAFPISIDASRFAELAGTPSVCRRIQRSRSRLAPSSKILLGVDRLDYTKGIDIRLRAFGELLRSGRVDKRDCVLVQVAVPTREYVPDYKALRSQIERMVGEINGEFGELGHTPVHYLHRSYPPEELAALYGAADVMLVTPLRDGMNLVAKEYVASRIHDTGVLVLSEFAGAAEELREAVIVNPHDLEGVKRGMEAALDMSEEEQARRMNQLRTRVNQSDVFRWAARFFNALGYEHAITENSTNRPAAGLACRV